MPEFWRRVGTTSPPLLGPLSAVLSAHMSSRATTAFSAPVDARARPQYTQCAAQDNVSPSMPSEVPTRRLLPCALMRRRDGRITSRGAAPRAPLMGDPAPLQPLQCVYRRANPCSRPARGPLWAAPAFLSSRLVLPRRGFAHFPRRIFR